MSARSLSPDGRDARRLAGLVSAAYVVALLAVLVAGPVVLSATTGAGPGAAIRRVVPLVGAGYLVGAGLLLR